MERPDQGLVGTEEERLGRARHEGLVEVDDVGLDDATGLERAPGDRLAAGDGGDRPVGGEVRRRADGDDAPFRRRPVARRYDACVDAQLAQAAGQAEHLALHAAEHRQRVRRDQQHAHHEPTAPLPFVV